MPSLARQLGSDARHPLRGRTPVPIVERPPDEGRDDEGQLSVQVGGELPALRQLVGGHLGDQVLEGSAVAEKTKVGQRSRREHPAQQIQRLGPGRRLPRAVGLTRLEREALAKKAKRCRKMKRRGLPDRAA